MSPPGKRETITGFDASQQANIADTAEFLCCFSLPLCYFSNADLANIFAELAKSPSAKLLCWCSKSNILTSVIYSCNILVADMTNSIFKCHSFDTRIKFRPSENKEYLLLNELIFFFYDHLVRNFQGEYFNE